MTEKAKVGDRPRAGTYARLSKYRPGETATIRQDEDTLRKSEAEGWEVVRRFVDSGRSGWTGQDRAAFDQMITAIENGEIDYLVVYKFDRLTRNLADYYRFDKAVRAHGVHLVAVADGTDTRDGWFVADLMFANARRESEQIQQRVRRQKQELAHQGRFNGGPRPFGFEQDGATHRSEEVALIREAADRVLAGESLRGVVNDFVRRGVKGPHAGNPLSPHLLRTTLTRYRTAGLRIHHDEVIGAAAWEPILSREVIERLRAILLDPRRRNGLAGAAPRKNVLAGLLYCQCGKRMVSTTKRGGRRMFRCVRGNPVHGCGRISTLADVLDDYIAGMILHMLATNSGRLQEAMSDSNRSNERAALLKSLADDERRLAALGDDLADGLPMATVLQATRTLETRIDQAKRELARLAPVPAEFIEYLAPLDTLAKRWPGLTLHQKRVIITAFVTRITVGKHQGSTRNFCPQRYHPDFTELGQALISGQRADGHFLRIYP